MPARDQTHFHAISADQKTSGGASLTAKRGRGGLVALTVLAMFFGLLSAFVTPVASQANAAEQPAPIFFGCDSSVTFDEGSQGWRSISTRGFSTYINYGEAGWSATEGNPGGAAKEVDRDGQWQEMWTPPLAANGFSTDYSFSLGRELQFDYKNDTGIAYDVYVAMQGANGKRYFYVFRPQITNSREWTNILVPMDASKWVTQFKSSGPYGTAPSAAEFASVLGNVDHFAFSIEGRSGSDTTLFDNFGLACETDLGDAPASYGTALLDGGASHGMFDFDASSNTAPLMLGPSIDVEKAAAPSAGADGDDVAGIDDEDGILEPIVVTTGVETTMSVAATNNGSKAATLAGWIDLDGNGTFDEAERVVVSVSANSGTADYQLTFPAGTTTENTVARFRLYEGEPASPVPTGKAHGGEVEDYPVSVIERGLRVSKTSTQTPDSRVGDTIGYTVTVTNTGEGDYTQGSPAVIFDDLAGVLDDAEYNADAAANASDGSTPPAPSFVSPSFLNWSGPLASGESVTLSYSVTLAPGGDRTVQNVAWAPNQVPEAGEPPASIPLCEERSDDGLDTDTAEPCAATSAALPALTIRKTADTQELPSDGGTVSYIVTVENVGPGDFSEAAPASMIDDLSGVLDDSEFGEVLAPASGTVFDETAVDLRWSGALAAGESVQIQYTVNYDAKAERGDHLLVNSVCVPVGNAANAADPCRSVEIPGAALQTRKTVNPTSGAGVFAGQDVSYTLYFENTGAAPATVDHFDDLSGVLDDAGLFADSVVASDGLTAVLADERLVITGSVPVGETLTVTYTVRVNAFALQGDHVLNNALNCTGGDCAAQTTRNPIHHFAVAKSATPLEGVRVGDTVEYTVTITNEGEADYTAENPAGVSDDMSDVLDDASYNGDAAAVASDGSPVSTPVFAAPTLAWAGALAVGESVTISYTVTVTNLGDHDLVNVAAPDCGAGVECEPAVAVEILLPSIMPAKTSDPASGTELMAGDVVNYTLSWTNNGRATSSIGSTDELSDVLDDGTLSSGPVVDDAHADAVTVVLDGETLRVEGDLAAGETVTVSYQVTIGADGQRGNNVVGNVLTSDVPPFAPPADCSDCPPPFEPPATAHPIGELAAWKSVDPASGATVQPGREISYTLHFENTGEAPVAVNRDDVLLGVLDDAAITAEPLASDAALSVGEIAEGRFAVAGILQPGQLVTVSYRVTVNPDGERGDDRLGNFLVNAGEEPVAECVPADGERADCTVNHVSNVTVAKDADRESGSTVAQGEKLTYTLTFENVSKDPAAADVAIDYTDHMVDVLDDATLTVGPNSSSDAVTAVAEAGEIRVSGAIASGDTVTVSYTITAKAYEQQGDHHLGNVVAITGEEPVCASDSMLCTSHELTPPPPPPSLAITGTNFAWAATASALGLLILGGGALLIARRRRLVD